MDIFVHANGLCESNNIGSGTRIWAFAHVLPKAVIGKDCNICDHVFIENDVILGDRVTVKCGVQIWDGIHISDDVFIGPNATFTNDIFPRSKVYPKEFLKTKICKSASIGANATILPGVTIHPYAMVGAGAIVTKDVPPYAIVVGNPAKIIGYVKTTDTDKPKSHPHSGPEKIRHITSVKLIEHPLIKDLRGDLTVGEFEKHVPFPVKRYFMVLNVPGREVRGEHAHKECHQYLLCVKGSISVTVDDGVHRDEYTLNSPNVGLYLPPMVWGEQYNYTDDAIMLVFASHYYDTADYVRDYKEFVKMKTISK